jgi:hypothetical protein
MTVRLGIQAMTGDQIREKIISAGEAPWVREMKAYFAKHGTYRGEDLWRLLGDPTRRVEIGPEAGVLNSYYQMLRHS